MDKERKTQLASLTQRWVQSTVTEPPSKPDISATQFIDQVSFCPECTIQYVRGSLETEILPVFSIQDVNLGRIREFFGTWLVLLSSVTGYEMP